jgi:hypothetical protein
LKLAGGLRTADIAAGGTAVTTEAAGNSIARLIQVPQGKS